MSCSRHVHCRIAEVSVRRNVIAFLLFSVLRVRGRESVSRGLERAFPVFMISCFGCVAYGVVEVSVHTELLACMWVCVQLVLQTEFGGNVYERVSWVKKACLRVVGSRVC